MNYKIDLHTHSNYSNDGGITLDQYQRILDTGTLDYIAITDHNLVHAALKFQNKIGPRIIVGEEIKSAGGDIIGLYLKKKINKGLSIQETVKQIKAQAGLVYIPHPFDQRRSGVSQLDLDQIIDQVDIIETYNARFLDKGGNQSVVEYNKLHQLPSAAGSDSHGLSEIGKTYSVITGEPTKSNLPKLLKTATFQTKKVSPTGFFNPLINKLKHKIT